jgi:protein SCO1/2
LLWGLGLTAVLMIGAAGLWVLTQSYSFHGSVIDNPTRAADFTLTAQDGKPFQLSRHKGNIVVLFFGYTSCPDVCPTTLSEFKKTRVRLPRENNHVEFVFVTVDPERDTQQKLRDYLNAFDPSFIGLTGTMAELDPVWKAYGVYREKQPSDNPNAYTVDHSARVYIVDASGNLRLTYSFSETADDMAPDLNYLIGEIHSQASNDAGGDSANVAITGGSAMLGNLKIENAWARPAPAGATGGVYLTMTNSGTQADALVSVQSPVASSVEIHQTTMQGDVMKMSPVSRIDVANGQKVELKPGGYHIMLVGLNKNLAQGDRVPLTLKFERTGDVKLEATVIAQ